MIKLAEDPAIDDVAKDKQLRARFDRLRKQEQAGLNRLRAVQRKYADANGVDVQNGGG